MYSIIFIKKRVMSIFQPHIVILNARYFFFGMYYESKLILSNQVIIAVQT